MTDSPGGKALVAMKKLNSSLSQFKTPGIPTRKNPKVEILTEEKYVEVCLVFFFVLLLLNLF